eukprot:5711551-Prymnesium_polylepis.1
MLSTCVARRDTHEPALHRATNGHDARGEAAACSQRMMGDQPGTTGRAGDNGSVRPGCLQTDQRGRHPEA